MAFPRSTFSGYPFDDDIIEDDPFSGAGFRSTLDSLAARHPELADHFQSRIRQGPQNSWGSHRKRRGSGTLGGHASGSTEKPALQRQYQGFPFDDFPSEFRQHIPEEFSSFCGPATPEKFFLQTQQDVPVNVDSTAEKAAGQPLDQPDKKDFSTQTDDSLFEQGKSECCPDNTETKSLSQYGLRNTVDLGQKCESSAKDEASRGARSMSAPPEDCRMRHPHSAMGQSISGNEKGHGTNDPKSNHHQFTNNFNSPSDQQPHVRHIPIFVEGRDEPVVNTDLGGQQFVPHEAVFVKSEKPKAPDTHGPIFNAAQKLTDPPKQKCNSVPGTAKPQVPPPVIDPITKIQNIQKDVLELMSQVETFTGTRKDKQYIFLDEMLTRNLLKLDDVDTEGKENIRQARKEAIKCIQKCIAVLEAKADSQAKKVESVQATTAGAEQNKVQNSEHTSQGSNENIEQSNSTTKKDQQTENVKNESTNSSEGSIKDAQSTSENQNVNADTVSKEGPICSS